MPPQGTSTHAPPAPTWPQVDDATSVLFLIDASSRFERQQLVRWIDEHRPEGRAPTNDAWVEIPASRRRNGQ